MIEIIVVIFLALFSRQSSCPSPVVEKEESSMFSRLLSIAALGVLVLIGFHFQLPFWITMTALIVLVFMLGIWTGKSMSHV